MITLLKEAAKITLAMTVMIGFCLMSTEEFADACLALLGVQ